MLWNLFKHVKLVGNRKNCPENAFKKLLVWKSQRCEFIKDESLIRDEDKESDDKENFFWNLFEILEIWKRSEREIDHENIFREK